MFGRLIPQGESLSALPKQPTPPPLPTPAAQRGGAAAIEELIEKFAPRAALFALDDVILPEDTSREVAALIGKIAHRDILFNEWGLSRLERSGNRLAFNLYGPPGTGKTMLAEALAGRFGKNVIEVSYAEIESKYVGDTPKNIAAAFRSAAKHDAALFFDEADSILGRRMTNVTQAADHGVNVSRAVMLKQLDAFQGIVMFATNLARNFDSAFVRRIPYHISLGPPDLDGRERLWRKLVPPEMPGAEDLDHAELARESDGLVGGDLRNALMLAAAAAVVREGPVRRVVLADMTQAIAACRRSKRDVGESTHFDGVTRLLP